MVNNSVIGTATSRHWDSGHFASVHLRMGCVSACSWSGPATG